MNILLFTCKDGKFVNLIIGANAPRLMKAIANELEKYEKFKKGDIEIDFVSMVLFIYAWLLIFYDYQK